MVFEETSTMSILRTFRRIFELKVHVRGKCDSNYSSDNTHYYSSNNTRAVNNVRVLSVILIVIAYFST